MYDSIRSEMKTGDVVAFSGKGLFSDLIKFRTGSQISHVGIVANTNVFDTNRVMICESTTLIDLPDATNREVIKGVQMHFLSQRLDSYKGQVYWYPIKERLCEEREKKVKEWLSNKHASRTPYDMSQALGAGMDFLDKLGIVNKQDYDKLYCSELVTKALQIGEMVDENINASETTPADVLRFSCVVENGRELY